MSVIYGRPCLGCRHYERGYCGGMCKSPKLLDFARAVEGDQWPGPESRSSMPAWQMRSTSVLCGPGAAWFEQEEPENVSR